MSLLAGLMLAVSGIAAQDTVSDAVRVVDAFHEALAVGDSAGALEWLDADVVIFESGGVERSREEYAGHHLAADMAFAGATTRDVRQRAQRLLGEGRVAVVLSEVHTAGEFRGRTIDSTGVETMVLRRTGGGWRIIHVHWSSRRSPA